MYYNLFDSHIHSDNSPDGVHAATFLCENAVARGLSGIAITDHCEMHRFQEQQVSRRLRQSYFETLKARVSFCQRLIVSFGMELGQPNADYALSEKILAEYPYDFVLGSLHSVQNINFHHLNAKELSGAELDDELVRYYTTLLEIVSWGKFDALAHLTYPVRYVTGRDKVEIPQARLDELVEPVLRRMVEKGIALELNTSGYRQGLGGPMPAMRYLSWYRQMGGETITIGSDAHSAPAVGSHISDAMELLAQCGFTHFAFYRRRKPEYLRIV